MAYGAKTVINTIASSENNYPKHKKEDFLFIELVDKNEYFVRFIDNEFNVYDYMLYLSKNKKEVLDSIEYFIEFEDSQYFNMSKFNTYKKVFKENYVLEDGTFLAPVSMKFEPDNRCFVTFSPYEAMDFNQYSISDY